MKLTNLNIVSAGMVTSVGMDAANSSAAIRAGLDNFQLSEFRDFFNEPLSVASIKPYSATDDKFREGGQEHLIDLCKLAIEECVVHAGLTLPLTPDIAIFVLSDDTRPKPITEIIYALLDDEQLFSQCNSNQRYIQAFTHGESSCIYALAAADHYLTNNSYVMLLAVDSWLNTPDIEHCLQQNRINSSNAANGFIPGEAAAACLLSKSIRHAHEISIAGLGSANEHANLSSDQPCYGIGLASAIKSALQQADISADEINLRFSDLSGEQYFFEEAAYAWARLLRAPSPANFLHQTIAAHVGHVGCSFGVVIIAYLWQLLRNDRLNAEYILMHLSSAQSSRGAAVFQIRKSSREII